MNTLIDYKGKIYVFDTNKYMTDDMFSDRCWFIVKNNDVPWIHQFADAWIAHKYLKCTYSEDVMDKLKELESKMM
jgi:hypothetical protein